MGAKVRLFPVPGTFLSLALLIELSSHRERWNQQANLSGKLLPATKHFSIFNVFTSEENIS